MQSKICGGCLEDKPLEEFTKANASRNFKASKSGYHSFCKTCNAGRAKEWRKDRPNYRGSGKIKAVPLEDRILMSAIRQRLVDAKTRCKKFSKEEPSVSDMELYQLFLKQNRCCALTGAPLVLEKGHPLCLSLDQKDPSKGYTLDNVQWLAWCVNRAKGDLTLDHFYEMCETILDHRKVQRLSNGSEN